MKNKIAQVIAENKKIFNERIPTRTMNKDNPQYVLGWNACRYLSESLLSSHQLALITAMEEEVKKRMVKYNNGNTKPDNASPHNATLSDFLSLLSESKWGLKV